MTVAMIMSTAFETKGIPEQTNLVNKENLLIQLQFYVEATSMTSRYVPAEVEYVCQS
jgi:hypothetical protein